MPRVNRFLSALGALTLLTAATSAHAQDKTPANAFAFIRDNMGDGSWQGSYEHCDDDRANCYNDTGPIRSVSYLNSSYCQLRFGMNAPSFPFRDVDLTRPFQIYGETRVYFDGPVRVTDGTVRPAWYVDPPSSDIGRRVVAALNYLQGLCKQSTPW